MVELEEEAQVEKLFRDAEIDGLFIPHANFGQEETAAILEYNLKVPVLLWGPRDGSPVPGAPFRDTDTPVSYTHLLSPGMKHTLSYKN